MMNQKGMKCWKKWMACCLSVVIILFTTLPVYAQDLECDVDSEIKTRISKNGQEISIVVSGKDFIPRRFCMAVVFEEECLEYQRNSWNSAFLDFYSENLLFASGSGEQYVQLVATLVGEDFENYNGDIIEMKFTMKADHAGKLILVKEADRYNFDFSGVEDKEDTIVIDLDQMLVEKDGNGSGGGDTNVGIKGTYGDLNGDGKITLNDAQYLLKAVLQIENLSQEKKEIADINYDKKVDLQDVQFALKGALKIVSNLDEVHNVNQLVDYIESHNTGAPGTSIIASSYGDFVYWIQYTSDHLLVFESLYFKNIDGLDVFLNVHFTYDPSSYCVVDNKINFDYSTEDLLIYYDSEAEFDYTQYNDTNLDFQITMSNGYPITDATFQKLANSAVQVAFSCWDMLLFVECNMNLSDIGFLAY